MGKGAGNAINLEKNFLERYICEKRREYYIKHPIYLKIGLKGRHHT